MIVHPPAGLVMQAVDRSLIHDAMCRYARGIDRRDWALVRSTFHEGSQDSHGEFEGDADGFITWLSERHASIPSSTHLLGNCQVEFFGPDVALVETYFWSRRSAPAKGQADAPPGMTAFVEGTGRYIDRFERRDGEWRVTKRHVLYENKYTSYVRADPRTEPYHWSTRDGAPRRERPGDRATHQTRRHV